MASFISHLSTHSHAIERFREQHFFGNSLSICDLLSCEETSSAEMPVGRLLHNRLLSQPQRIKDDRSEGIYIFNLRVLSWKWKFFLILFLDHFKRDWQECRSCCYLPLRFLASMFVGAFYWTQNIELFWNFAILNPAIEDDSSTNKIDQIFSIIKCKVSWLASLFCFFCCCRLLFFCASNSFRGRFWRLKPELLFEKIRKVH